MRGSETSHCRSCQIYSCNVSRQHLRGRLRPVSGARSVRYKVQAASLERLSLFSPSKINLFLRVMRRREDGYHDLASLFHVIDLGDTLDFALLPGASQDRLSCDMEGVPTDASNLVIKALDLFRRKTGVHNFFDIRLQKVVPHGAGLGGGSGNAATTLWAANEVAGRPATDEQLGEWAGDIGSDISVFFSRGAAYCTGRGEVVEDVAPPLPLDTPLLLVKPALGLSTPEVFRALDLDRRSTADPLQLLAGLRGGRAVPDICVNDLEPPAFSRLPELAKLKKRLVEEGGGRFSAVFMTGSGSTIVCVGSDEAPPFLQGPDFKHTFVAPARLIARQAGAWYQPSHALASAALS